MELIINISIHNSKLKELDQKETCKILSTNPSYDGKEYKLIKLHIFDLPKFLESISSF